MPDLQPPELEASRSCVICKAAVVFAPSLFERILKRRREGRLGLGASQRAVGAFQLRCDLLQLAFLNGRLDFYFFAGPFPLCNSENTW